MQASDWHFSKDSLPDEHVQVLLYDLGIGVTVGYRYGEAGGECWWSDDLNGYVDIPSYPVWTEIVLPEETNESK